MFELGESLLWIIDRKEDREGDRVKGGFERS